MRFRDLGPLTVEIDGVTNSPGGRKPAAILGLLLVNANRRVSVESVMAGVWGEAVTERTPSTLESHVWRLRQVLEPTRGAREAPSVLINDSGGYRLLAPADKVDSLRFQELAEEARDLLTAGQPDRALRRCDEALELWRGQPYDIATEAAWAETAANRLDEVRAQISERRIDALLASGAAEQAVTDVDELLARTPFREHLWAQRMLALYRLGRSEEALRTYQRARTMFDEELGIDPSQELQELQRRVLDQDEQLGAPREAVERPRPVHEVHLPPTLNPLLGRDDALDQLVRLAGTSRLVTVAGAAGCGKTRLAIEVARRASTDFPDGVWFVDLASVDAPSHVVDVVISTLGLTEDASGTLSDALRAYMRDRRVLLVLDNCEHVLAAAADLVESVLADNAEACVLTTSREPLGVDGETIWSLGPLDLPDPIVSHADPDEVRPAVASPDSPAVELFLQRLRASDPTRTITEDDLRTITAICVAVDGLPLAIELAAARVRSSTLPEIAEQVAAHPGELSRIGRGADDHRRTMQTAVDWSHRLLSPEEQAVHRRVSVLPGWFTRGAAQAVAEVPPVRAGQATEVLANLVHRSLLVSAGAPRPGGPTLFRQLATVRDHAEGELAAADETAAAADRRDEWVLARILERPEMGSADTNSWYSDADDAFATVRATLENRLVHRPDAVGIRILSRLSLFWYYRSRMAEAQRWLTQAFAVQEVGDPLDVARLHFTAASAVTIRGRTDLAQPHTEQALALIDSVDLDSYPVEELIDVGHHFGSLAISAAPLGASGVMSILASRAHGFADRTGTESMRLLAETLDCMVGADGDPVKVAERAAELYAETTAAGQLMASWIPCSVRSRLAMRDRDPEGTRWAARNLLSQVAQGGRYSGLFLEAGGIYASFADDLHESYRLFTASRIRARRSGTAWPRHLAALQEWERVRNELTREQQEQAAHAGAAFSDEQILAVAQLLADGAPAR